MKFLALNAGVVIVAPVYNGRERIDRVCPARA